MFHKIIPYNPLLKGGCELMNRGVVIAATADIHSPRFLSLFIDALSKYSGDPDIVVLAGDLVDKNQVKMLKPVYDRLLERFPDKPLIAVYGNEEYRGYEEEYRKLYPRFRWLDDEYLILDIRGVKTAIIGTRGALDKPTSWQSRNMPWIVNYYRNLPVKINNLINEAREKGAEIIVLITHYGVVYDTLIGEPRRIWRYLASRKMGEIVTGKVDLVIHGHAHNSVKVKTVINNTLIYNVALPANKSIVEIKVEKKTVEETGILKWFKQGG